VHAISPCENASGRGRTRADERLRVPIIVGRDLDLNELILFLNSLGRSLGLEVDSELPTLAQSLLSSFFSFSFFFFFVLDRSRRVIIESPHNYTAQRAAS